MMLLQLSVLALFLNNVAADDCSNHLTCNECIVSCGWSNNVCINCDAFTNTDNNIADCDSTEGCSWDNDNGMCTGASSCNSDSNDDDSKPNLGLILGLSLGIPAGLGAAYALWKYKPWSNRAPSNGVGTNL